jgi:hypothetical protein
MLCMYVVPYHGTVSADTSLCVTSCGCLTLSHVPRGVATLAPYILRTASPHSSPRRPAALRPLSRDMLLAVAMLVGSVGYQPPTTWQACRGCSLRPIRHVAPVLDGSQDPLDAFIGQLRASVRSTPNGPLANGVQRVVFAHRATHPRSRSLRTPC